MQFSNDKANYHKVMYSFSKKACDDNQHIKIYFPILCTSKEANLANTGVIYCKTLF